MKKKGDGKTAIDFLQEIKHSNWHIFTKPQDVKVDDLKISFLPYMLKSELGTENDEQSTEKIIKDLPEVIFFLLIILFQIQHSTVYRLML